MKRLLIPVVGAIVVMAMVLQGPAATSAGRKILTFDTMAPVTGPFVGSTNPIRGINGGGLPWQIEKGKGQLTSGGSLKVEVRGLVLVDGPPVPAQLQGTNPIPNFVAIVSCLTIVNDEPAEVNVATGPFPASMTGDSKIKATVSLPSPCIAPIVFVGPNATTWFAATGQG